LIVIVARNTKKYQKVCSRIPKVPTEQGVIYKKGSETSFIGNISKTMVRN